MKKFHTTEEKSWNHEVGLYKTQSLAHENILTFRAADNKDNSVQFRVENLNFVKIISFSLRLTFFISTVFIFFYNRGRGKYFWPNIAEFANMTEIFWQKNSRYIGPQYKRGAQYCRICQYVRNFWAKNFRQYCPPC
jgi:hypothetical protein